MSKLKWNDKSSKAWESAWSDDNIGSSIGAIGGGLTGVISAGLKNAEIKDTTEEEAEIANIGATQFSSGSFDNLLENFDVNNLAKTNFSGKDLRGLTGGQMALGTLGGVVSGASAGAQVGGPWGALAGGVIGLGSGLAGIFTGNAKANNKASELNRSAREANRQYLNNFNNAVSNTQNTMFNNSLLNIASYGGPLFNLSGDFNNGLTFIDEGGTHESNPFDGVMVGIDQNNTPNLVEEGEIIYNDYVFSNRLKPTKKQLADGGFTDKYNDWTFAKIVEDLQKESSERPNDIISKAGLDDMMSRMITMQEEVRMKKEANKNKFKYGGKFGNIFEGVGEDPNLITGHTYETPEEEAEALRLIEEESRMLDEIADAQALRILEDLNPIVVNKPNTTKLPWQSALRYASPLIHGVTLLNNLKKPDYSSADRIESAARAIPGGSFTPIGDYLDLQEVDQNILVNPILANAAANRRAVQNQGVNAGQTIAGLVANNYITDNAIGNALIQGIQANNQIKSTEAQFNRGTNQANAQMGLHALAMDQQRAQNILNATAQASQLRNQLDAMRSQAISNSITGLTDDLGNIGREFMDRNLMQKLIESDALRWTKTKAKNGGMLTRRRRKNGK